MIRTDATGFAKLKLAHKFYLKDDLLVGELFPAGTIVTVTSEGEQVVRAVLYHEPDKYAPWRNVYGRHWLTPLSPLEVLALAADPA